MQPNSKCNNNYMIIYNFAFKLRPLHLDCYEIVKQFMFSVKNSKKVFHGVRFNLYTEKTYSKLFSTAYLKETT